MRPTLRWRRSRAFGVAFLGTLVTFGTLPMASAAAEDLSEIQGFSSSLIDAHQCSEAWDYLWSSVVEGSAEASAVLSIYITFGELNPPPVPSTPDGSVAGRLRLISTLAVLAMGSSAGNLEEMYAIRKEILSPMWKGNNSNQAKELGCFAEAPPASCVQLAKAAGILNYFPDYVREFREASRDSIDATCGEERGVYGSDFLNRNDSQ